ncbi:SdpI family protein [Haloprofundus salilacus]|uniref:SdpI family protein n=1 Tax=Haloprofundus salilacus TaxID=2876190 RepID=UPI001CCF6E29|nr:SdpI family protein [Haloprofundus salilacus]
MNSTHRFTAAALFVVISGALSVIAAPELPAQLVIHWNAAGQPDGTMAKTPALALIPVLSAALLVLFAVIPRIGPLRENITSFRPVYDWFVVVFTAFMATLHGGILAFNLGYEFDFTLFVLAAVALLFYYAGILLSRAKRNWFIGIRTPWTLSSDEVWDQTHELGSRLFKLTAVIALIGLLFGEYAVYFLIIPALLTAGVTLVYSYYLYEQIESQSGSGSESNL